MTGKCDRKQLRESNRETEKEHPDLSSHLLFPVSQEIVSVCEDHCWILAISKLWYNLWNSAYVSMQMQSILTNL